MAKSQRENLTFVTIFKINARNQCPCTNFSSTKHEKLRDNDLLIFLKIPFDIYPPLIVSIHYSVEVDIDFMGQKSFFFFAINP